jgi:hypothetical protein
LALNGADLEEEDANPVARNTQFELYVAAALTAGDLPNVIGEPDIVLRFRNELLGVAAKRVQSMSKLATRGREAVKQICRHRDAKAISRGIVALNVDLPALGQGPPAGLLDGSRRLDQVIPEIGLLDKNLFKRSPEIVGRFAWVTYLRRDTDVVPRRLEIFGFHQFQFFPETDEEDLAIRTHFDSAMRLMAQRFAAL